MSNYPPGVSGMESAIAGPSNEWDETRNVAHECADCEEPFEGDVEGTVIQWDYSTRTFYWECPQCRVDVEEEDEPEEPEAYED